MADKKTITLTKGLIKLPDGTYIAPYTDTKGAFEIGDIGQALFINETEGLRRRLNGQTIAINAHTQPLLDKLKSIRQLYPQLFCAEDRWQQIAKSNYLGQVGKFVIEEEPKQYNYKFNVTKSGDVIIDDNGIAYNFINNTNSLYLPQPIPYATANTIEAVFKINVTDTTHTPIMGNTTDAPAGGGIVLRTDGGTRILLWGTLDNVNWNTGSFDTGIDLSIGDQYIKFTYDGTNYQVHKSLDNVTWTSGTLLTSARFTNPAPTWLFCTGSNSPLNLKGTADLKECYIKINGNLWWQGATLVDEIDLPPYIRLPRIIETQGAPTYEKLGELTTSVTRRLIACKKPTFEDTYWYNLYSDGWCEQGARILQSGATNAAWTTYTITLRIPYVDDLYNIFSMTSHGAETSAPSVWAVTPNTFVTRPYNDQGDAQWSTRGWTNAHLSYSENITYDGEPQYPYFIQISQGQTTQTHIRNDWEIINPYSMFDCKQSMYPLNNASWLLSKGQWNSSKAYKYAYEALCIELDNTIQTNTTVLLPSGGRYTKHLQTLHYDTSKVVKVGAPTINNEGIMTNSDDFNCAKLKVPAESIETSNKFSLVFKVKYNPYKAILVTRDTTVAPHAVGIRLVFEDTSIRLQMSYDNADWNINLLSESNTFVDNTWYYLRFSFDNGYGYKLEYSENNDIDYKTIFEIEHLSRFNSEDNAWTFGADYAESAYTGCDIDLKTVLFDYERADNTNFRLTCTKTQEIVWAKEQHESSESNYNFNFIVDRTNETFRLPIYDRMENKSGAYTYYYIGDVAQNTSLVDIGRITDTVNDLKAQVGQLSGEQSTVEVSKYGTPSSKYPKIFDGTALGTHKIDLSSYIPNDGHEYDVYMYYYGRVGDTSGNNRNAYMYNEDETQGLDSFEIDGTFSPNAGNFTHPVVVPLPVNSRILTLHLSGTDDYKFGLFNVYLKWWRRY